MAKYRPQRISFILEYTPPDGIIVEEWVDTYIKTLCDEAGAVMKKFLDTTPGLVAHRSSILTELLEEKQPYEG